MPPASRSSGPPPRDFLLRITGTVQGVGFRPFVARLAASHRLKGYVFNDEAGVMVRLLATLEEVEQFVQALRSSAPPASVIREIGLTATPAGTDLPDVSETGFKILESPPGQSRPQAAVTPDLALCADCRRELLDPGDRRHAYPFINCTNCGPRYSIILELPYDRERTTMSSFVMCPACASEYADPLDRRYHAQPNACPDCGPSVALLNMDGTELGSGKEAIRLAVCVLEEGRILAIKGIGGFHLMTDAGSDDAVARLRQRKHRDEKPFAVMFPSMESLEKHACIRPEEAGLLRSTAAPIVLVKQLQEKGLSTRIAPENPWVGALLPYTPLHTLIMEAYGKPVVATSANLSEEPLCTDNAEALERLSGIADCILLHDRPIARPVDDSVQRLAASGPILLRRARGYAPAPLALPDGIHLDAPVLCVGAHLKSTVAIAMSNQVVLSPHIGDLSNTLSIEAFRNTIGLLTGLYGGNVDRIVCDLHPDYISTQFADSSGLPVTRVQHHLAHILACLLEHGGGPDTVLGVSWDGTGYGVNGTIWGGEFLVVNRRERSARRIGSLRPFQLPGGEEAIRRTGRCALGALHSAGLLETGSAGALLPAILGRDFARLPVFRKILERQLNAPVTSSAGRLFDAAAAILGVAEMNRFEGQAGMRMEFAAAQATTQPVPYPFSILDSGPVLQLDWAPMLETLCTERLQGKPVPEAALNFHATLADMIASMARACGIETVALSGGCFQNAVLLDLAHEGLTETGFQVMSHRSLPPNDNNIAAGQALAAAWDIVLDSGLAETDYP